MHKAYLGLALIAAAALSACGQSTKESAAVTGTVSLKNATVGEVQDQVVAAQGSQALFQPGRWEGSVKIVDMKMDGMDKLPPAVAQQMKAHMGQGSTFASCLTPEDAADARKALTEHQQGNCRYDHFTMAGGTIDAALVCTGERGSQKMTMTGSYTKTSYHLVNQSTAETGGPMGAMSMKMELDARRTGECTGTEDKSGGTK